MHKYHPAEGIIHVGRVPFLIKIILFASSLLLLLPSSIIKKKESLNRYRSKRGCDPLPRFFSLLPVKAQLYSICGWSGERDREEPRDNHVTKETTSVSCQTKLLLCRPRLANLASRQNIDLRYDDPKKPESGFYVCVVISGSARPDNPSLARN